MFWACLTAGWVFIGNPWVFTARREAIALSRNIATVLRCHCLEKCRRRLQSDLVSFTMMYLVNGQWSSSQWCSQHIDMQCCATMFDTRAKKMCLQSVKLVSEKQVFHKCVVSSNCTKTKAHVICWGFSNIYFFPDVENVDMKKGNVSVPPVCTKRDKILQGPSPQGLWQNFCWNIFWGNKERNTCFILSSYISSWSEINNDIVHQNAL